MQYPNPLQAYGLALDDLRQSPAEYRWAELVSLRRRLRRDRRLDAADRRSLIAELDAELDDAAAELAARGWPLPRV